MNHESDTSHDGEGEDAYDRPSKSQKKRDMHELQALGVELLGLPLERIKALDLPERVFEAVVEGRRITAHEGRRRQLQYIGKLMRTIDPEPIREAVASFKLGHAKDALALHESEAWRVRLIEEDDALAAFIDEHDNVDVQQLRSLVRAARKDREQPAEARKGRAWRELFQFVKAARLAAGKPGAREEASDEDHGDE